MLVNARLTFSSATKRMVGLDVVVLPFLELLATGATNGD